MGYIADFLMDLAMEQEHDFEIEFCQINEIVKKMEKEYIAGILQWNTQHNGKIMVKKMSKSHLENTISFIKRSRNDLISQKWIELLGYELEKRR